MFALVVDRAGITQDSAELLRSSGFFGRLLHAADDPSADPVQLLVVAVKLDLTADDDWQRGKDRDPDRAGPWTEHFQAAQKRMETRLYREVKGAIVGALRQSTSDTSEPGLEQVAKHLMDDLAIHVVSAPQFRRLWRQDPEDPARIREPEQSGMPQLRECLRALASQRDTLFRDRIVTAGDQFRERIFRTLEVIRSQGGDGTRAEEENTRIRAELHSFLFGPAGPGTEFRSRQGGFREFLSSTGTKGIQDTVERAAHTAEKHVRAYLETELSNAHWATLRAAVRRGGTYHGARRIDLPNDFAVRIDEPLGFAWSKEILASVRQRTGELGKAHLVFVDRVAEWACIRAEAAREPLEALRKQTRSDMRTFDDIGSDRVDQLRSAVRQRLLQRISLSIRRECKSFVESHRDVGRGVKLRMLDLIEGLVPSVMEVARDSAVKIMQSEFRSVVRDIRAAVDDHRDPIEGVSEAIAPSARTEPELPTRIEPHRSNTSARTDTNSMLYRKHGEPIPYALLRETDAFGIRELDLVAPPSRFWTAQRSGPEEIQIGVDEQRVEQLPTPCRLAATLPADDNWHAQSKRTLDRLEAWFLVCEDPQRRLDIREVATLGHQASLVRHILDNPHLDRVLIADEVGLGKTIEAGLLISNVLERQPELRILYLAPARLVRNVQEEFERLGLHFRKWVAGEDRDATLQDPQIIASIHRAAIRTNFDAFVDTEPWDAAKTRYSTSTSSNSSSAMLSTRPRTFMRFING